MQELRVKHRSAPVAAWINCLAPGMGLYYLGERRQAWLILLLAALPWFVLLFLPWQQYPFLVVATLLLSVVILMLCMWSCWQRAPELSPLILLPSQRWYRYTLFWFSFLSLCLLWLALLIFRLGIQPYQVSTNSMAGTINKTDWVLISSHRRDPVDFSRGEIVLLIHPETHREVLQRVVGLPGERITVHGGGLFVDGSWQPETYVDDMRNQRRIPEGVVESSVPAGQFFVLADNRDQSRDSRYWGALPADRILGRVIYHLNWQRFDGQELISVFIGHSLTH